MTGTLRQYAALMAAQIGTTELPPGSNRQKYGAAAGQNGVAWCAWTQWWVGDQVGVAIPRTGYTPAMAAAFKAQGRWSTKPQPGALVFYNFPGDKLNRIQHVGWVEKVLPDGRIQTIEGNTSAAGSQDNGGAVLRKVRNPRASGVVGYGLPEYAPDRYLLRGYLQQGSKGRPVEALQRVLRDQFGATGLVVDGDFGPATRTAVRTLQAAHHLEVDGVVGRQVAGVIRWDWSSK